MLSTRILTTKPRIPNRITLDKILNNHFGDFDPINGILVAKFLISLIRNQMNNAKIIGIMNSLPTTKIEMDAMAISNEKVNRLKFIL